jgi:hypothetical protein
VQSIAIKNHSAPENPNQHREPALWWHFSAGSLLPDRSMVPTNSYKKRADRAENRPEQDLLSGTSRQDPVPAGEFRDCF